MKKAPNAASASIPARDRTVVMLLILTGILMFVLDGAVVNIALPTITQYFDTEIARSQWVVTSYLMTVTSMLLIFGRISDFTGRLRLFLGGFALFTLASLACGLSSSLEMLVLFRAVQAMGAAAAFSISAAVIFEIYPPGEQGRAMGYIGTTVSLGSIAGPILGGYLVDFFGWQYIFLINLPIGLALLALGTKYLRLKETRIHSWQMDWPGAFLLIVFVVSLTTMLGEMADALRPSPALLASLLLAIASLMAFIVQESRIPSPLLDLSVFRVREFVLPNISLLLVVISSFAAFILGPFYFEGAMGFTPSQVGTIFLIVPAIMVFGSPLGGWLYDKYHYRHNSAMGILIVAGSLALMSYSMYEKDLLLIIISFVLMGLGSALFQSPINTEIMSALPPSMLATASSFSSALRNLGMAMGVSISSIMLAYQLQAIGYSGPVLEAGSDPLSRAVSQVLAWAALLCILGFVAAFLRNRNAS